MRTSLGALLLTGAALGACGRGASVVGGLPDPVFDAGFPTTKEPDVGVFEARDAIPIRNADVSCGGTAVSLTRREATALLVIDRSGSMQQGGSDGLPKWQALLLVLQNVLPQVPDDLTVGAIIFPRVTEVAPTMGMQACEVDPGLFVEPGRRLSGRMLGALQAIGAPRGNTPTWAALDAARRWYAANADLTGQRFVILATDGAPNCNPELSCGDAGRSMGSGCIDGDRTTAMVATLRAAGVDTFVIGLAGVQDHAEVLDAMAVAGGRARPGSPRYYGANSAGELAAQFASVTSAVADCGFTLDAPPPDANLVDLRLDGASLLHDVSETDGWNWSSDAHTSIRFFGRTCDVVRASTGGSRLVAAFGCPAPVPP